MAVTLGGFHRQVLGTAWLLDGCARRTRAVGGFDCLPADDNTPPLDGVRAGPGCKTSCAMGVQLADRAAQKGSITIAGSYGAGAFRSSHLLGAASMKLHQPVQLVGSPPLGEEVGPQDHDSGL
jgi:hypothetical protein